MIAGAMLLASTCAFAQAYLPSEGNIRERREFVKERFGIFLHWGIYASYAQGEWYMNTGKLNAGEYAKAASGFYPAAYDASAWVKAFKDAEYVVEDVEFGPFRVIKDGKEVEEDVMTNAYITHKGNRVSVGSGWSLEQRRQYKEHPEELIGKTITVQYFEETTDKDGNISLRFPTCKFVYENGRDV